ncbi:MAG: homoserine kinase [Alphaproteobacteria bacterium]|nr:homoserine kinase [Alphaproteobacteria bacterium]
MAVYTDVAADELEDFLGRYELGKVLSFKGIAEGVENSNYYLHTQAGTYILTLFEKRVAEADLPFFVATMEHLAARGISCPRPVADTQGRMLARLAGRPAVIVSFLDGLSIRRPTTEHCRLLGAGMARMHLAAADFPLRRANALGPASWKGLYAGSAAKAESAFPGLPALIGDELASLDRAFPEALPQGLIHADLFPDNVFFLDGALSGFIDFYFACTDALAYDLAIALNAWCFEPDGMFNVTKARALFSGYRAERPLAPVEIEAMPKLARGAALRFLLTRLHDWLHHDARAFVTPKDPLEYAQKLRFHRASTRPGELGL